MLLQNTVSTRLIFIVVAAAGALLLQACTAPPQIAPVNKTITVQGDYDAVWDNIVNAFAEHNLSIKTIAKDSGIIAAERLGYTPSIAVCDDRMLRSSRKHANINVRVKRGATQQLVTVNSEYSSRGIEMLSGLLIEQNCASTGYLEQVFLQAAVNGGTTPTRINVVTPTPQTFAATSDASKVPAGANCKRVYAEQFVNAAAPKAYVLSGNKADGMPFCTLRFGANALARALQACNELAQKNNTTPCKPYAVDDQVVWLQ